MPLVFERPAEDGSLYSLGLTCSGKKRGGSHDKTLVLTVETRDGERTSFGAGFDVEQQFISGWVPSTEIREHVLRNVPFLSLPTAAPSTARRGADRSNHFVFLVKCPVIACSSNYELGARSYEKLRRLVLGAWREDRSISKDMPMDVACRLARAGH